MTISWFVDTERREYFGDLGTWEMTTTGVGLSRDWLTRDGDFAFRAPRSCDPSQQTTHQHEGISSSPR